MKNIKKYKFFFNNIKIKKNKNFNFLNINIYNNIIKKNIYNINFKKNFFFNNNYNHNYSYNYKIFNKKKIKKFNLKNNNKLIFKNKNFIKFINGPLNKNNKLKKNNIFKYDIDLINIKKIIKLNKIPNNISKIIFNEYKKNINEKNTNQLENTSIRNYLEILLNLPWNIKTKINNNIIKSWKILNKSHYGLENIKEIIIEYLSVYKKIKNKKIKLKSPILCFIGSPGVGKTSLVKSIADATNRKFTKMSLGGVRDESEIKGHRRTYIGALPGRIIKNLLYIGVNNPVFLLDEIDKISDNNKNNASSTLLEILDSEQNNIFMDNYLDISFDLSDVMFIATANSFNIPEPLLDRMEIIQLSNYSKEEKIIIAENFILPKQIKLNGLEKNEINITIPAIKDIVNYYTYEPGVRSLEQKINIICRKVAKILILNKKIKKITISSENIENFLGYYLYENPDIIKKKNKIGLVHGLAWTQFGGDILNIESRILKGNGNIINTGTIGNIMKESINIAHTLSCIKIQKFNMNDLYKKTDLHIHFPEGSIPKDGPSAGSAILVCILSSYLNIPIKYDIGITGEITLKEDILPIGGLKEKLDIAVKVGIKIVIIPYKNIIDLANIPSKIIEKINIIPVNNVNEILNIVFCKNIYFKNIYNI